MAAIPLKNPLPRQRWEFPTLRNSHKGLWVAKFATIPRQEVGILRITLQVYRVAIETLDLC